MSESLQHSQLVGKLLGWTTENHREWKGSPTVITADHIYEYQFKRPPKIGEAVPDVFAKSLPSEFCLIGEAKTTADLETNHSQRQIKCYLKYLQLQSYPFLVIATPWNLLNTAKNLLRVLVRAEGADRVKLVFLQDINGIHPRKCSK